jgi:peroxiredoxin
MVSVGDPAPEFELPGVEPATPADEHARYGLDDGEITVLSFYMFDFNPTCTGQLCGLRDAQWFTLEDDLTAYGISTDSVSSHRAFAEQNDLSFPLLSDSDGTVSEAYGVLHEEINDHHRVSRRSVFVVDGQGTVAYAWMAPDPLTVPDWQAVADAVDGLRDGD